MAPSPNAHVLAYGAALLFSLWLIWAITGFAGAHSAGWAGAANILFSGSALAGVAWLAFQLRGRPKEEAKGDGIGFAGLAGLTIGFAWLLMVSVACIGWSEGNSQRMAEFGESFGPLNALFSGVAIVGVVFTLYRQHEDGPEAETRHRENRLDQERIARINGFTSLITIEGARRSAINNKLVFLERTFHLALEMEAGLKTGGFSANFLRLDSHMRGVLKYCTLAEAELLKKLETEFSLAAKVLNDLHSADGSMTIDDLPPSQVLARNESVDYSGAKKRLVKELLQLSAKTKELFEKSEAILAQYRANLEHELG